MFKGFWKLSALEKVKKVGVPLSASILIITAFQGAKLRDAWNKSPKLDPPSGPTFGLEEWADKIRVAKDEIMDSLKKDDSIVSRGLHKLEEFNHKLEEMNHKVKEKIEEIGKPRPANNNPCDESSGISTIKGYPDVDPKKARKIKLIVMGDSLVAGVGNDDPLSSPVLPQMIAKFLSKKYQTDVEWFSSGVVGGTVVDLRTKVMPKVRQTIMADHFTITGTEDEGFVVVEKDEHIEYVVVVISGLNDWKDMIINFPTGLWPRKFKSQLGLLVRELQSTSAEAHSSCRVFLPNLPLVCIKGDPKYIMGVKPLVYFVDLISYIWDLQKEYVAAEETAVRLATCFDYTCFQIHRLFYE